MLKKLKTLLTSVVIFTLLATNASALGVGGGSTAGGVGGDEWRQKTTSVLTPTSSAITTICNNAGTACGTFASLAQMLGILTAPNNHEIWVDGSRTDTYTPNGTILLPYKSIAAAITEIEADYTAAADKQTTAYSLHVGAGTYADNLTITTLKHLKISGIGVVISGNITLTQSPIGGSGQQPYTRIEFEGTNGIRAEKGSGLTISGSITGTRTNDSLTYLNFKGCWITGNQLYDGDGTWVTQYENSRIAGTIDTGTFADPDSAVLIETTGWNEFAGAITDKVSFYNVDNADFYGAITTTPIFDNYFTNSRFHAATSIIASKVLNVDSASYKSLLAVSHTLTGMTVTMVDGTFKTLTVGAGEAGVDYKVTFDGEDSDGNFGFDEDAAQFTFDQDLNAGANDFLTTGSIGSTLSRILKGWFTDLEVTNPIAGSVTGNAGTATALAANGTNCSSGSLAGGVDASGASEDCTDVWTEAENTSAGYVATETDPVVGAITGIVKSNGAGVISAASAGSDYQAPLGYTAEDAANKSTNVVTDGASDTKYPSVKAAKDYADGLVAGLLDYRGAYDASVNTFPAAGGSGTAGAVMKGDMWIISVAGTLGTQAVQVGDSVIANVDTPAQTASNWNILNSNISFAPEDSANKVTSLSAGSTDTQYPSAKLVYDQLAGKQASGSYALSGANSDITSLTAITTILQTELAADPLDPDEGKFVCWATDGTGTGDDGDQLCKRTAGGVTKTFTLFDYSTGKLGDANTATALAADGANCSAGSAPLGVDASGAADGCFDVWTEAENTSAGYLTSLSGAVLTSQASPQTIGATGSRLAKLWATDVATTDLTVTNAISGSVTGNAGTCTTASAGDSATDFFGAGYSAFINGIANALTAGSIELGHATANTLSASGGVLSIEGIPIVAANSTTVGQVPTITGSNTYSWQTPAAPVVNGLLYASKSTYSYTLPAGTLGTSGGIRGKLLITSYPSSNNTYTLTFGSTTLTLVHSSESGGGNLLQGFIEFEIIANGATNAQFLSMNSSFSSLNPYPASGQNYNTARVSSGSATEDSTANKTVSISVSGSVTFDLLTIEKI